MAFSGVIFEVSLYAFDPFCPKPNVEATSLLRRASSAQLPVTFKRVHVGIGFRYYPTSIINSIKTHNSAVPETIY